MVQDYAMNQQLAFYPRRGSKVGEILDREHLQIKREHEDLRKALVDGTDRERILEIGTDLFLTMLLHFESEERAMGKCPDPRLVAHLQLHTDLIESLKAISIDIEHHRIDSALGMLKLFERRLSYHMGVEDAEMERIISD
jgi:hemerythrin-like metal-binding protein